MEDDVLFHTPPPVTQETQTQPQEDAPMLGLGMREHHDPNRNQLSPSGPRPRKPAPRYRRHSKVWNFYICMRHIYVPFDIILYIRHICIYVPFDVILCIRHICSYNSFTHLLKLLIDRVRLLHEIKIQQNFLFLFPFSSSFRVGQIQEGHTNLRVLHLLPSLRPPV